MNRRKFLKLAGIGTAAATLGSVAFRLGYWWDQAPAADYQVLSREEAAITASIADALFPGDAGSPPMPNGVDAGVVEGFDRYLAGIDQTSSDGLRLIVHAIDDMAIPVGLGMTRFHKRPRDERIEILHAWDTSGLLLRRSGFRALKFTLSSRYCSQPQVLAAAGVHFSCGGAT